MLFIFGGDCLQIGSAPPSPVFFVSAEYKGDAACSVACGKATSGRRAVSRCGGTVSFREGIVCKSVSPHTPVFCVSAGIVGLTAELIVSAGIIGLTGARLGAKAGVHRACVASNGVSILRCPRLRLAFAGRQGSRLLPSGAGPSRRSFRAGAWRHEMCGFQRNILQG